jgi:hypothetical protein
MLPPHFRKVRAGFTLKLLALGALKQEEEGSMRDFALLCIFLNETYQPHRNLSSKLQDAVLEIGIDFAEALDFICRLIRTQIESLLVLIGDTHELLQPFDLSLELLQERNSERQV